MMTSASDQAGSPTQPAAPKRHWRALAILTALVLAAHAWVTFEVAQEMRSLAPDTPGIQRMEATYVTEVKLSAPPVVAAATAQAVQEAAPAAVPKKRRKVRTPDKAASAPPPEEAASAPPVAEEAASTVLAQAKVEPPPEPAPKPSEPAASTPSPVAEAASSPQRTGPTFIWPKATKVNYKLEGNYRGPFYGTASVEWIRQGNRYQVQMDVNVPFGYSHMTSEGDITPQGLSPRRYESVNRMLFKTSKAATLTFEEDHVVLANGQREPRLPDMQDPVSHLIQLAYRFMLKPEQLKPGNSFALALAFSKKTMTINYDVIAEEALSTAIGEIPTIHVKPRVVIKDKDSPSGEIWFAPGLQYLPVRIFTKWTDEMYLDMQMEGAPQQTPGDAEPPPASGSAAASK